MKEEHDDEDAAEGADDGGTGREVEPNGEIAAEGRDERAHGPTDRQARADAVGEQQRSDRKSVV